MLSHFVHSLIHRQWCLAMFFSFSQFIHCQWCLAMCFSLSSFIHRQWCLAMFSRFLILCYLIVQIPRYILSVSALRLLSPIQTSISSVHPQGSQLTYPSRWVPSTSPPPVRQLFYFFSPPLGYLRPFRPWLQCLPASPSK